MALEQTIADLATASNLLTTEVSGKQAAIDARMLAKEKDVDAKVAQAQTDFNTLTPARRVLTTLTIGGSADYLYPVWWQFPNNSFGVEELTICRHYSQNAAAAIGGLIGLKNHAHVYALLLEMVGNDVGWGGDAIFMQIKRFKQRYAQGVSHMAFLAFCDAALSASTACPVYSGCYLRGGGLTYQVYSNSGMAIHHQDGSAGVNASTVISGTGKTGWHVKPIPMTAIKTPVVAATGFTNV